MKDFHAFYGGIGEASEALADAGKDAAFLVGPEGGFTPEELKKIKRHRGRIPTDPRIAILMWGTYSLIREYCSFRSPMPNRLCQFIIAYLQILDILPTDTEIDTFWVRAQLRYIRSKKEAACDNNQSSIMNGAQ
jgi:hypothetical protein